MYKIRTKNGIETEKNAIQTTYRGGKASHVTQGIQNILAREHVNSHGMLTREHVSTQATLAREQIRTQDTLAQEHVSTQGMQGTLTCEHVRHVGT